MYIITQSQLVPLRPISFFIYYLFMLRYYLFSSIYYICLKDVSLNVFFHFLVTIYKIVQ